MRPLLTSLLPHRGRARLWNLLMRLPEFTYTTDTWHGRLSYSSRDHVIGWHLFRHGAFERDSITNAVAIAHRLGAQRNGYFVDVGANLGTVCIAVVRGRHFQRAIAIEPDPRHFTYLQRNVEQNGLSDRIMVIRCAAADANGAGAFALSSQNPADNRLVAAPLVAAQMDEEAWPQIEVAQRRLDDLLRERGVAPGDVGLLWLDIQGHEIYALMGATGILSRPVPVVMEFGPYWLARAGVAPDEVAAFLAKHFEWFWDLRAAPDRRRPIGEIPELYSTYTGLGYTDLMLTQ